MAFGFIKTYDPISGIGSIDTATLADNAILFVVIPGTRFNVGDRVRYSIGQRAMNVEVDTEKLGESIR